MPLIGFFAAVIGGALFGLLIGGSIHAVYLLRGSPGATGLEILVVMMAVLQGAFAGASSSLATLIIPRLNWSSRESFVVFVLGAVALQLLLSGAAFALASMLPSISTPYDIVAVSILMMSPINWVSMLVNWLWFGTIPIILLICSPWFRSKFEG